MRTSSFLLATAVTLGLLSLSPVGSTLEGPSAFAPYEEEATDAVGWLLEDQDEDGCIAGSDGATAWTVQAVLAAGKDPHAGDPSLVDGLETCNPKASGLSAGGPTNDVNKVSRYILGVTAAGENPYDFAGHNWIQELRTYYIGGSFQDPSNPNRINDDIFAITALRSAGASSDDSMVQGSAQYVKDHQNEQGGWDWSGGNNTDTDMTGAALWALVTAHALDRDSQAAQDAIAFLEARIHETTDGCFPSMNGNDRPGNSHSTSWALLGLLSMHQDPRAETWANPQTPWECLAERQPESGGITSSDRGNPNRMATYQAAQALSAIPYGQTLPITQRPTAEFTTNTTPRVGEPVELEAQGVAHASWQLPNGTHLDGATTTWTPTQEGDTTFEVLLLDPYGVANLTTYQTTVQPPIQDTQDEEPGGDGIQDDDPDDPQDEEETDDGDAAEQDPQDDQAEEEDPQSEDGADDEDTDDQDPQDHGAEQDDEANEADGHDEPHPPSVHIDAPTYAEQNAAVTVHLDADQGDAPVEAYRLDWGPGDPTDWRATKTFEHAYQEPGNYTLTAWARDEDGHTSPPHQTNLTITPTLTLGGPTTVNRTEPATFHAETANPNGPPPEIHWETPNQTATGPEATFHFQTPGLHTIQATATDQHGNQATANHEIWATNHPPKDITIQPLQVEANTTHTFTATGTDPEGDPIRYVWQIAGETHETNPLQINVGPSGERTLMLNASDSFGAWTKINIRLVVYSPDDPATKDDPGVTWVSGKTQPMGDGDQDQPPPPSAPEVSLPPFIHGKANDSTMLEGTAHQEGGTITDIEVRLDHPIPVHGTSNFTALIPALEPGNYSVNARAAGSDGAWGPWASTKLTIEEPTTVDDPLDSSHTDAQTGQRGTAQHPTPLPLAAPLIAFAVGTRLRARRSGLS